MKKCCTCKENKEFSEFHKNKSNKDGLADQCKVCVKEYRENYKENLIKYKDKYIDRRGFYSRNSRGSEYYQKTRGLKRKTDPVYLLKCRLRGRAARLFKEKSFTKSTTLYEYLGCSPEEAKVYIEKMFVEGMTWDNRVEWHIDHIIPLSSAQTEDELIKLFHYTNLQPLWAKDNLSKGCKL